MPLNKVIELEIIKPEEISEFNVANSQVDITLNDGASWQKIPLLPKPEYSRKPDIKDEGRIYTFNFKAGTSSAPDPGFYIAKLKFADGSYQIAGTLDFPVYMIADSANSDFEELTIAFTWKYDAILSYEA